MRNKPIEEYYDKPWGSETILEHNSDYMLKRLVMNKGHKCSIQYHEQKQETIYVLSGVLKIMVCPCMNNLKIQYDITLHPNQYYTVPPFYVHRMEAMEDCVYLEASTPENSDVVRIEDDYGRV